MTWRSWFSDSNCSYWLPEQGGESEARKATRDSKRYSDRSPKAGRLNQNTRTTSKALFNMIIGEFTTRVVAIARFERSPQAV